MVFLTVEETGCYAQKDIDQTADLLWEAKKSQDDAAASFVWT